MRSAASDEVVSQLALLGLRPDDVRYVVNSHFHFDHCGGNEFFPQSTFLVQRREMEAARAGDGRREIRYKPERPADFDHPLDYRLVDGEHDVFGDGTVVLSRRTAIHRAISRCECAPARARELVLTADAFETVPGMPSVADPANLYSETRPDQRVSPPWPRPCRGCTYQI